MAGKVEAISCLAEGIIDLRVRAELRSPAPGRFVHVAVPGFMLRRPISLCGYDDGAARLVFAVKGKGTAALSGLQPGDTVDLLGALGNGYPAPIGKTILAGGGIGLPPLLYFANTYPDTHCIAGFRNVDNIALAGEFPSVDICTDDGSAGMHCYPHQRLRELLEGGDVPGQVLTCGPLALMKAVAAVCAEFNVPCFVSMEERMGCGVGACVVCACAVNGHYKRVCKDGPVFDAGDIYLSPPPEGMREDIP